jgi:hypothetical protein
MAKFRLVHVNMALVARCVIWDGSVHRGGFVVNLAVLVMLW